MADNPSNNQQENSNSLQLNNKEQNGDKDNVMAPKNSTLNNNKSIDTNENDNVQEDLEEIATVNENLDSLNTALDVIEQRADSIRAKLMELLTSNREIYQSIQEEKEKTTTEEQNNTKSTMAESSTNNDEI